MCCCLTITLRNLNEFGRKLLSEMSICRKTLDARTDVGVLNVLVILALVCIDFQVELLLDKLKQKGAIRRALFLHNRSPGHSKDMTVFRGGQTQCEELVAYLRVRRSALLSLLVVSPSFVYMIFPTCKLVFS